MGLEIAQVEEIRVTMGGEEPASPHTVPCRWPLIGSLGLRASIWTALIHDRSHGNMALLRPSPQTPKGTAPTCPRAGGRSFLGRVENLVRAEPQAFICFGGAQEQAKGLLGAVGERTDPRQM